MLDKSQIVILRLLTCRWVVGGTLGRRFLLHGSEPSIFVEFYVSVRSSSKYMYIINHLEIKNFSVHVPISLYIRTSNVKNDDRAHIFLVITLCVSSFLL